MKKIVLLFVLLSNFKALCPVSKTQGDDFVVYYHDDLVQNQRCLTGLINAFDMKARDRSEGILELDEKGCFTLITDPTKPPQFLVIQDFAVPQVSIVNCSLVRILLNHERYYFILRHCEELLSRYASFEDAFERTL